MLTSNPGIAQALKTDCRMPRQVGPGRAVPQGWGVRHSGDTDIEFEIAAIELASTSRQEQIKPPLIDCKR